MKFRLLRLALAIVGYTCLLGGVSHAQFKKVFLPDSSVLQLPSFFTAVKLLETDIPGKPLAVLGSFNTTDSANVFRSVMFNLLLNLQGDPQGMHLFEDTSQFVFQPPRIYSGCYDGNGIFYLGIGANNRQVVVKTNATGQMIWAKAGHHHEYYSMLCEGGTVTFMGQDESVQGAHDFSIGRLDASGAGGGGTMFGTPEFELPQKLAKFGNQYVMGGSSYQTGSFKGMLVKADANFEQVWGRLYDMPGKGMIIYAIDRPRDGHGYILSGRARGTSDSLFLMKTDTAGNPLWTKLYGIPGTAEAYNSALVVDPISGGYLLSGFYRGPQYFRPFILMTDSIGNVRWARDYADPGLNTDETFNDIIHCNADGMFYAVGDMVVIDSNQFDHKIFLVKVAADSGTTSCDSALVIGMRPTTTQIVGTTVEEPFQANTSFPIGNLISAEMQAETRCFVIVGVADGLPATGVFHVVNPSGPTLQLRAEVPSGGATLRVMTMTGEVVLQQWLEQGMQQPQFALPQLSSGMYLVSLAGAEWRYPTLRWVVQR